MILLMFLLGCSAEHFNSEINNNNIYICFSMKAAGDCDEETLRTFSD